VSVSFYNASGNMAGIDIHKYVANIEGAPVTVPMPHIVGIQFFHPLVVKKVTSVTTDGFSTFQGGADFYLVPHLPIPLLPPHGNEALELVGVQLGSGSKAWMSVRGVTVGGGRAATCVQSSFGSNQNCAFPMDAKDNLVVNFNSVTTEPTPGDRLSSALASLVDSLIGMGVNAGIGRLGKKHGSAIIELLMSNVWRRAAEIAEAFQNNSVYKATTPSVVQEAVPYVVDAPGKLQSVTQDWVDGPLPSGGA